MRISKMKLTQFRIYEITETIDNWLEKVTSNLNNVGPDSFDFDKYFAIMKVNKVEAHKIREMYKNESADYDELERMPSDAELALLSEYEQDQWLQLKEAYSHVTKQDIETYQTAIKNILNAVDNVIQ